WIRRFRFGSGDFLFLWETLVWLFGGIIFVRCVLGFGSEFALTRWRDCLGVVVNPGEFDSVVTLSGWSISLNALFFFVTVGLQKLVTIVGRGLLFWFLVSSARLTERGTSPTLVGCLPLGFIVATSVVEQRS
ncbi:hypothetical protein KC19_11G097400, partial [Ceratodon purpureus]